MLKALVLEVEPVEWILQKKYQVFSNLEKWHGENNPLNHYAKLKH